MTGIMFGIGAAAIYATVVILNKHLKQISSYAMTIMQLGMAVMVLAPYTFLTQDVGETDFQFYDNYIAGSCRDCKYRNNIWTFIFQE